MGLWPPGGLPSQAPLAVCWGVGLGWEFTLLGVHTFFVGLELNYVVNYTSGSQTF